MRPTSEELETESGGDASPLMMLILQIATAYMYREEEERDPNELHELAWQLVNETRPKDGG